ncbi:uncharacterized protein IWZ02DRAFT_452084 [Phyllosticta citriasiana]|uniref:Uncharacterized protein n=1 Tax=Phyllosticta citriasiana TaxID=595635 RepID=A0ABR1KZX6_9PEZI
MVLPFPYRLITAWINNPGPHLADGPNLEVVEAPWTCEEQPDLGPELSRTWLRHGSNLSLDQSVRWWEDCGFSPRLLRCGSIESLVNGAVDWLSARAVHETDLERFENRLGWMEQDLESDRSRRFEWIARRVEIDLGGLQELNSKVSGIRDQELRGTYLVLSLAAARGAELLSGPEERISIVKQLSHLTGGQLAVRTEEQRSGVRLVDRFNTVVRKLEDLRVRVQERLRRNTNSRYQSTASAADTMHEDWDDWPGNLWQVAMLAANPHHR